MTALLRLALFLLLAIPSFAKDKVFLFVSSAYIVSSIADTEVTLVTIQRDMNFRESNPIFSQRPTRREFYGKGAPLVAGIVYASYRLRRAGKKWWFVPMLAMTCIHTYLAAHEGRW